MYTVDHMEFISAAVEWWGFSIAPVAKNQEVHWLTKQYVYIFKSLIKLINSSSNLKSSRTADTHLALQYETYIIPQYHV